ncbi:MAG: AtpZ/AtpI family protein [Dehalococcoidia bacterium]
MTWRRIAYTIIGIGWFIAASIVLGALGGWWLDSKLDTKPWLALLGVTLGTVVAMFGVYRMLRPGLEKNKRKDQGKD